MSLVGTNSPLVEVHDDADEVEVVGDALDECADVLGVAVCVADGSGATLDGSVLLAVTTGPATTIGSICGANGFQITLTSASTINSKMATMPSRRFRLPSRGKRRSLGNITSPYSV